MSVYKRGDIWHYDFTVKGERQRGTTGFRKKADALQYVENLRRDLKLGTSPERAPVTIGQAADQWFASRVAGRKTATTTAIRLGILFRHLDRNLPIRDIGPREIEAALIARAVEPTRQGGIPKPSTVNRDMIDTTLRPVLSYAAEAMEETPRKVIRWAKLRRKEPGGRTRTFTEGEIAMWRNALPEWHRPLFDFIARYGVRLGEAFFPPRAVNVEAQTITLYDTKNGTDHTLHILPEDMPDLAARKTRAERAGLDTVWFRDSGKLTPIHWRAFQSASKAALVAAKIEDARPVHDLRHHAATVLLRGSKDIKAVQAQLNHKSITSTARYAKVTGEDIKRALRHTYGTKTETPDEKDSRVNVEPGGARVT